MLEGVFSLIVGMETLAWWMVDWDETLAPRMQRGMRQSLELERGSQAMNTQGP